MSLKYCFLTLALSALPLLAKIPQEIIENPALTGDNMVVYPYLTKPAPALTDAPEGFVPFHIEHYGRHGSRFLDKERYYVNPLKTLQAAKRNGALSARGEKALETLTRMEQESRGRYGDLTDVGCRQHRGIARRMVANFPEVFADSAYIDAKSTIVVRCVLSMTNALMELTAANPALRVEVESSKANQWYLQQADLDTVAHAVRRQAEPVYRAFAQQFPKPRKMFDMLFSDQKFVRDSVDNADFFGKMYDLASSQQNHDWDEELYDLFTIDELYNHWLCKNAGWYLSSGNAPATLGRMPYSQRYLLADFLSSADHAIARGENGATLRFGHDSVLLPFVCFLEMDEYGAEYNDLNDVAARWRNYRVFPMASNVQLVFYHNASLPGVVLVKGLLNEQEVDFPTGKYSGHYYDWNVLKNYYRVKLDAFTTRFKQ